MHDLNEPIPSNLKGAFTCVFDGGCLEHIFNFPQAIKNCMEMVAVGGSFLAITPANSFCGHGFYQFSPELYYRILSVQNGFAVQEMVVWELDPGAPQYRVKDPDALGHRVVLASNRPTYLMVLATRTNASNIFEKTPQQSDYIPQWSTQKARSVPEGTQGTWRNRVPYFIRKFARRLRPEPDPFGSEGFERVEKYRSALR